MLKDRLSKTSGWQFQFKFIPYQVILFSLAVFICSKKIEKYVSKSIVMAWVGSPAQSQMSLFLEYLFPRKLRGDQIFFPAVFICSKKIEKYVSKSIVMACVGSPAQSQLSLFLEYLFPRKLRSDQFFFSRSFHML